MKQNFDLKSYLSRLKLPEKSSHKGQNGKLMIIGGSDLFHAASRWSLDVASRLVDMVFYSSTPENNDLIKEAKLNFWNGIVVGAGERENYLQEAAVVLIGPGMTRTLETKKIIDNLIKSYPDKKMVIDAGALQMVDPNLLNEHHLITPHHQEMELLLAKFPAGKGLEILRERDMGILLKGPVDEIYAGEKYLRVVCGHPGMTKGGTGDVLSGLVAGLYCETDGLSSLVAASYFNKLAGEVLAEQVGPFFNATDLAAKLPEVMWHELNAMMEE